MSFKNRRRVLRGGVLKSHHAFRKSSRQSFSVIEDGKDANIRILSLARKAVRNAAIESRRLGLPAIIIKGNKIFEIDAKTTRQIATVRKSSREYKVGEVLNARKN